MAKQLVIGIGTGRCGTMSLSRILSIQKDSNITHELKPYLPWEVCKTDINSKISMILRRNEKYIGDIAFYYLPYIDYILSKYPSTKIICLRRGKKEVIASYMIKTKWDAIFPLGRNHWMDHDGTKWNKNPLWDQCYPKYKTKDKEQAIGTYWDEYYSRVNDLCKIYPGNIRIWEMNRALNTKIGIGEILSFIGIPQKDQMIVSEIRTNSVR